MVLYGRATEKRRNICVAIEFNSVFVFNTYQLSIIANFTPITNWCELELLINDILIKYYLIYRNNSMRKTSFPIN